MTPPRTRGKRRGRSGGGDDGSSESGDEDRMEGVVANQGRVRRCAKDFWHVVGWAFNCSVAYPKRWKYWKVWLGYMLDVIEGDWEEREAEDREGDRQPLESTQSTDMSHSALQESLLVRYLSGATGRSSGMKRVVGAVFAAGSADDLRAYPEVFPNETRDVQAQNGQKRKRVDSINPEFGGLDDVNVDEMAFDSSQTDQPVDSSQNSSEEEVAVDPWMAYPESIFLRQRILVMVSLPGTLYQPLLTTPALPPLSDSPRHLHRFQRALRDLRRARQIPPPPRLLPPLLAVCALRPLLRRPRLLRTPRPRTPLARQRAVAGRRRRRR